MTKSRTKPDALDEMVAEFSAGNPEFPILLAAAERRRTLLRDLADRRREQDLSQTAVAAAMQTSQPALARLETTAADTKLSTVERFAAALGYEVEYSLVPINGLRYRAAGRSKPRRHRGRSAGAGRS